MALPAAAQQPEPPDPPDPPALFALGAPDEKAFLQFAGGGSYLGVDVAEIGAERAKALKLTEERGVELTRVAEDSPAAKAGLKAGDVVLDFNGQRVEGTEQFVRLVRETPVGRVVKLLISRGGTTQTISATIGKHPGMKWARADVERDVERARKQMQRMRIMIPDTPRAYMSWRTPALGIEGESLEGQLAGYFGVQSGVLIRSVLKGTAAEKAGLKAGDVIQKVDDTKVTTPREISSAIRSLNDKKTFPVMVRRNQKELTLSVTVEETGVEKHVAPRSHVVVHKEQ
jgi:serine protease Do